MPRKFLFVNRYQTLPDPFVSDPYMQTIMPSGEYGLFIMTTHAFIPDVQMREMMGNLWDPVTMEIFLLAAFSALVLWYYALYRYMGVKSPV